MSEDISVVLRGIGSLVVLALIYYFYRIWPVDTELGRNSKKYIFNFKVKPENHLQIILPVFIMSIITSWIIMLLNLTNKTPSTNLPNPILFLVVGVIVQPLFEEVLFRGFLFGAILAYTERFKTSILDSVAKYFIILFGIIFISGYLFAGWHYITSDLISSVGNIVFGTFLTQLGGLVKLIDGILYGLFFWLSGRNLSSSYAAHAATNFTIFLFVYSVL